MKIRYLRLERSVYLHNRKRKKSEKERESRKPTLVVTIKSLSLQPENCNLEFQSLPSKISSPCIDVIFFLNECFNPCIYIHQTCVYFRRITS